MINLSQHSILAPRKQTEEGRTGSGLARDPKRLLSLPFPGCLSERLLYLSRPSQSKTRAEIPLPSTLMEVRMWQRKKGFLGFGLRHPILESSDHREYQGMSYHSWPSTAFKSVMSESLIPYVSGPPHQTLVAASK